MAALLHSTRLSRPVRGRPRAKSGQRLEGREKKKSVVERPGASSGSVRSFSPRWGCRIVSPVCGLPRFRSYRSG